MDECINPSDGEQVEESVSPDSAHEELSSPLNLEGRDRKLVTQPYDFAVHSLSSDIEEGRVQLSVEYQRDFVWDSAKSSRLIESLLLNVPVPVIYFAETRDGAYEVIDGLQRLTAIHNFLQGELSLRGLTVLQELNGLRIGDLDPRDRRRLQSRTLRCIVITEESDPDIKFDVFERLNTGAAVLNAQELRNSVYRGPFNESLRNLASRDSVLRDIGVQANRRMDVEEMILRFFALHDRLGDYQPPLRQFLNSYMRDRRDHPLTPGEEDLFISTLEVVRAACGPDPFRSPSSNNPVNKALFDAIMIPFAAARLEIPGPHAANNFQTALRRCLEQEEFQASIGRATADRSRVFKRIATIASILQGAGQVVPLPDSVTAGEGVGDDGL